MTASLLWLPLALGAGAAAPDLPNAVHFKTETTSLSRDKELAIASGRVYWRGGPDAGWEPIPPDGLPAPSGKRGAIKELKGTLGGGSQFERPSAIELITADGDNLLAVSSDRRGYYVKLSKLAWTDVWGPPGARGPLRFDFEPRAVAMSHREIPYADIDGNEHPVSAGVTTVYVLSKDGRELRYADPWLPANFNRQICLPRQGAFVAENLSASASTIFVIDATGSTFTRLADFDTMGNDPALPYSYQREKRSGPASLVRTLPAEDWREHPRPPGPATTRITILRTGLTNRDRELRIEGDGGYWVKQLTDERWTFRNTGGPTPVSGWVDPGKAVEGRRKGAPLSGTASLPGLVGVSASVADFDPVCPPAQLTLTSGDESQSLTLEFHGGLLSGSPRLAGALLLPEEQGTDARAPGRLASAITRLMAGKQHYEVIIEVSGGAVRIRGKKTKALRPLSVHLERPS